MAKLRILEFPDPQLRKKGWATLAFLSILLPGVLLIYTFLATVGMLYQTNPL